MPQAPDLRTALHQLLHADSAWPIPPLGYLGPEPEPTVTGDDVVLAYLGVTDATFGDC